jgi:hypothetical protein
MKNDRRMVRVFFDLSVQLVIVLALSALAFGEVPDDLVKYTFSGELQARVDLNQLSESHLIASDNQGHVESHAVHLSSKDGTVVVKADFSSKKGLRSAIVWLVSQSGEQWSVVGLLEVERPAPPVQTPTPEALPQQTATPTLPGQESELTECSAVAYNAFLIAHDVENIKASLAALGVEDPLQAALQAREAELSELLRGIAENEGPKIVGGAETFEVTRLGHAQNSAGQESAVPLGSQKKELEKLKQDREALEDELAAWGVM